MNTYHEDYEISALFPFNFVTAFFNRNESSENHTMSVLAFIRGQKELYIIAFLNRFRARRLLLEFHCMIDVIRWHERNYEAMFRRWRFCTEYSLLQLEMAFSSMAGQTATK